MSVYGDQLNPYRIPRKPLGIKGIKSSVVITNNPSTIDQNQLLTIRFPNLGDHDVIVPNSCRLSFNIELDSTDVNATIVQNLGRAIINKISIKLDSNEVYCLDDSDIYNLYLDLFLPIKVRTNSVYQGIQDANVAKLRVGADDALDDRPADVCIARAYGNRFYIPLDFEMLTDHCPFYQSGLASRLSFELTFNSYARVIRSTDVNSKYKITNISLEYDLVCERSLSRVIHQQYQSGLVILYERVLRQRKFICNKSDTVWNINLNTPARSLTGILLIFESVTANPAFGRNSELFYNPLINKVSITIEGKPNQLYAHGLQTYQHWDEIAKFAENDLSLVDIKNYFTTYYALWLDFRTNPDRTLHGNGRRIEGGSDGITLLIEKTAEAAGVLNCYIYLVMDAQINIANGQFKDVLY